MSAETARVAIVTAVKALAATWSAYTLAVEYDNRNLVNLGTQVSPYLSVEIMLIDGEQASLGPDAAHRVYGSIILTAWVHRGSGDKPANDLLAHFYPSLHMSDAMPPVRTSAAKLVNAKPSKDWFGKSAVIPFWYDN
jgi:hypothetical protein